MGIFKPIALLMVLQFLKCLGNDEGELKAVIVLFRHGDRSPIGSWPNDIYYGDSSLWPDGYGQLNNFGKQRHYNLGKWFRKRYDGFLPLRYNHSDIYVRSTDVDRTLMSAESNLAGLYPPTGDQVWDDNVLWQPIPVHTSPVLKDPILTAAIPCAKHSNLQEALLSSEEFQELDRENAILYQNISELAGYAADEVTLKTFTTIFTAITIYREFNLLLPDWTDYYRSEISSLAAKYYQTATYTTELARLRAGPFYNYLIDFLDAVQYNQRFNSENLDVAPKMLMLSAHETTVSDFTNSIGVYPGAVPQFASTVIWELKARNESDYYLNLYFRNSSSFSPLIVRGCEFDCNLNDFKQIITPIAVTVNEWEQECSEDSN